MSYIVYILVDLLLASIFLREVERISRTNGFKEDMTEYLKAPGSFQNPVINEEQLEQLNTQIELYSNLASCPVDNLRPHIENRESP